MIFIWAVLRSGSIKALYIGYTCKSLNFTTCADTITFKIYLNDESNYKYRLRYLMNNFFGFLACTLYVTYHSLYKVKVNSPCNRNSKVQQRSQLLTQGIDTLNNHNTGTWCFYSPVSRVHFNMESKACKWKWSEGSFRILIQLKTILN